MEPQVDELHAILIHCDSWQPLFQGLRGAIVPLVGGERNAKAFADSTVHFHELLILEKPPEMSKKKRKPKGAEPTVAGVPLTATPVLEAQESSEAVNAQLAASAMEQRAQDTAVAAARGRRPTLARGGGGGSRTETALAVVPPESIHRDGQLPDDVLALPQGLGRAAARRGRRALGPPPHVLHGARGHPHPQLVPMLSETVFARRRNSAHL